MIQIVATIVTTGIVVAGAVGAILSGFYKTNKEAEKDHTSINQAIDLKISTLTHDFDKKIDDLRHEYIKEAKDTNQNFKEEFNKISRQIEDMKTRYVTNENFKTYAETMSQLLKMSTDRMERIENTLDDIRDDINSIIRNHNIN